MKPFNDLFDDFLAGVPGCSYPVAVGALRRAALEFCERTRVWRVALPAHATSAGVTDYLFAPGIDRTIVRTLSATVDGQPVLLLRPDQAGPGAAGIVVHNTREFSIYPAPSAGQQVVFRCALAPSRSATGLDDAIYEDHADAIATGAKAALFDMQNQPFTNPRAAIDERSRFEVAISRTIHNVGTNSNSAPVRVRMNSF